MLHLYIKNMERVTNIAHTTVPIQTINETPMQPNFKLKNTVIRCLGIAHLVLGLLTVINSIVAMTISVNDGRPLSVGVGIWFGAWILVTGSASVSFASFPNNRCLGVFNAASNYINTFLCIPAGLFVVVGMIGPYSTSKIERIYTALFIITVLEFFISIAAFSIICCQGCCCGGSNGCCCNQSIGTIIQQQPDGLVSTESNVLMLTTYADTLATSPNFNETASHLSCYPQPPPYEP